MISNVKIVINVNPYSFIMDLHAFIAKGSDFNNLIIFLNFVNQFMIFLKISEILKSLFIEYYFFILTQTIPSLNITIQ